MPKRYWQSIPRKGSTCPKAWELERTQDFWGPDWFSTSLECWLQRGECWEIRLVRGRDPNRKSLSAILDSVVCLWALGSHWKGDSLWLLSNNHTQCLLNVEYVLDIVMNVFHASSHWIFTINSEADTISLSPFHKWEKWRPENWRNLLKVT